MENLRENKNIEFKESLDAEHWQTWLKTCCAFANCDGGHLLFGYDDNGNAVGIENSQLDTMSLRINTIIRKHTSPILLYKKSYKPIDGNLNKSIIDIAINKSDNAIIWLVNQDKNPIMYVRSDGQTVQATLEEMQRALLKTAFKSFDETPIGITYNSNSFNELNEVYKAHNDNESLTEKLLKSFNLIDGDDNLTLAGYLFCDNSDYINANLVCTTWPSTTKGSNDYSNSKSFNGSAISLINNALDYISKVAFYSFGGKKNDIYREDIGSFSLVSLREAVVNAIAHRDYMILGGQISIDCFTDRVEISSPGCIVQKDFEVANAKLETLVSQRRNRTICNVLTKCKLMEEKGSGFAKIINDYSTYSDLYAPTYSVTRNSFTIVLKNKKFKFSNVSTDSGDNSFRLELLNENMFKSIDQLFATNDKYSQIVRLISENPFISYDQMAAELNITRDGVKFYIKQMKESCLIRRVGTSKSGKFEVVNEIDRPEEFLHLENDIRDKVLKWCKKSFIKTNGFNIRHTSYGLKHILQDEDGTYLTNGAFKGAMLLAGFDVKDVQELNWVFNISEKSPAIK